MRKSILTVMIPTYDRNEILLKNLSVLLPLIPLNVKCVILDNHSQVPVHQTISPLLNQYPNIDIKVVRNNANVGGNGNIMRCLEVCETDYVWILGDDDVVQNNAFKLIFSEIEKYPDAIYFNFSTLGGVTRKSRIVSCGIDDFMRSGIDDLGQIMFISSSIFSAKSLREHCDVGYHYAFTTLPHIVTLFSSLMSSESHVCVLTADSIVATSHKNTGEELMTSCHLSALGMPMLLSLPFNDVNRERLRCLIIGQIYAWLTPRAVYFSLVHEANDIKNRGRVNKIFSMINQNLYALTMNPSVRLSAVFYKILLFFPQLSIRLIRVVFNLFGKEIYRSNINRL